MRFSGINRRGAAALADLCAARRLNRVGGACAWPNSSPGDMASNKAAMRPAGFKFVS